MCCTRMHYYIYEMIYAAQAFQALLHVATCKEEAVIMHVMLDMLQSLDDCSMSTQVVQVTSRL